MQRAYIAALENGKAHKDPVATVPKADEVNGKKIARVRLTRLFQYESISTSARCEMPHGRLNATNAT